GNDPERSHAPRRVATRSAAREVRQQDAAGAAVGRRPRRARRLPGRAQIAVDVLSPGARQRVDRLERIWEERPGLLGWLTTVDHKRIALLYFFTTLAFFGAGGVEALLIRTQLVQPDGKVLSPDAFNQML